MVDDDERMVATAPMTGGGSIAVEPIERTSLHDQVVSRVRDLVVDGTLPAGQRINEVWLSGQLGVSRTPLREALKVLASEGLVELTRNRGTRVTVLSETEIRDMIMLMSRLEAFAAETAVQRLDDAALDGLRAMHEAILEAFERYDRHDYFRINQRFHLEIVRLAGNVALAPIHAALHARMKRVRYLGNDVPAHWAESVEEHGAIMAAFQARDAEAAAAAMRAHLENAWRRAAVVMEVPDAPSEQPDAPSSAQTGGSIMNLETIGFIGLGKMGEGFTSRLMAQGHRVLGYDIDADRCREAEARGVRIAASPAEVLNGTDLTLVCVISTKAVDEVVGGKDGLSSVGDAKGKIVVDHSTTELETTKRLARELKEATGADFVDAPVSGGPNGAAAGTLAIMAGGEDQVIERVRPMMEKLAARFAHMGDVGAGQATKLVNQVLVLANYVVIAEGINLGKQLGIDVAQIPHALATGHAGGNLLNDLLPRMVERDFAPRGYARQILKDLNLVQATAGDLPLPMVATATSLFRLLIAQGKSELDGAAIVALLDGSSGELPDG